MYTALAKVYDLFAEDDTEKRADYYAARLPRGEGMDLGCGTGALTLALLKRGYRVYGVDKSEDMLRRATDRAARMGVPARFVRGDAARPPAAHPLDFVLAANDVLNYAPRLMPVFAGVHKVLRSGGIFAFDVSSEYKLRHVLAGNTFTETKEDVTYIWQNFLHGNRLTIDFTVFSPQGETYIKTCETQTQYVRSQEEITAALTAAGFTEVRAYAFYKQNKPTANTQRIAFFARKK